MASIDSGISGGSAGNSGRSAPGSIAGKTGCPSTVARYSAIRSTTTWAAARNAAGSMSPSPSIWAPSSAASDPVRSNPRSRSDRVRRQRLDVFLDARHRGGKEDRRGDEAEQDDEDAPHQAPGERRPVATRDMPDDEGAGPVVMQTLAPIIGDDREEEEQQERELDQPGRALHRRDEPEQRERESERHPALGGLEDRQRPAARRVDHAHLQSDHARR